MANTAQQFIVDPLDAEFALSELQGIMQARGMSTTDLAVELGWRRRKVEEVLYSPSSVPLRSDLEAMAKVLDIDLDLEEE